jgi:hypothetical protein
MKVNQIVTEHKKGVRAMKYAKKPKSTVPLYGPGKQEAKLTPVKPVTPVKEDAPIGVVSAVSPDGKEVTIKKTDGSELKTTGSAVMPGADGKTAQLAPQAGAGLKPGTPVTNSETPVSEEVPAEEDSPGVSLDNPGAFTDALKKSTGNDPAVNAKIDSLIALDFDGTIDADQSLLNMIKEFAKMIPMFLDFMKWAISELTKFSTTPEFQQASPVDQKSLFDTVKDIQAMLPGLEKQAAEMQATMDKEIPVLQQKADRNANDRFKAKTGTDMVRTATGAKTNLGTDPNAGNAPQYESADDKLLQNMLNIAGVGASATSKPQVKESADITAMLRIAGLR